MTIKKYVEWTPSLNANRVWQDIHDELNELWMNVFTIVYLDIDGRNITDARRLAILECDSQATYDKLIDRLIENMGKYALRVIDVDTALTHANEWYPAPEGEDPYFSLDTDGFTLIDNRPKDEMI